MTEILTFAGDHPWLAWSALWLAWGPFLALAKVLNVARSLYIRTLRVIIVAARDWPPAHLDADGDWRPAPKAD